MLHELILWILLIEAHFHDKRDNLSSGNYDTILDFFPETGGGEWYKLDKNDVFRFQVHRNRKD